MRTKTIIALALLPGALVAGCASTPAQRAREQAAASTTQQKLDARLAGFTPGRPTDCLNQFPQTHTQAYGSRILYVVSNRLVYVNDTTGGCESMERGDYLVTVSNGGRLCRGDIGRTVTPNVNISSGSCALGSFTPYTRK